MKEKMLTRLERDRAVGQVSFILPNIYRNKTLIFINEKFGSFVIVRFRDFNLQLEQWKPVELVVLEKMEVKD